MGACEHRRRNQSEFCVDCEASGHSDARPSLAPAAPCCAALAATALWGCAGMEAACLSCECAGPFAGGRGREAGAAGRLAGGSLAIGWGRGMLGELREGGGAGRLTGEETRICSGGGGAGGPHSWQVQAAAQSETFTFRPLSPPPCLRLHTRHQVGINSRFSPANTGRGSPGAPPATAQGFPEEQEASPCMLRRFSPAVLPVIPPPPPPQPLRNAKGRAWEGLVSFEAWRQGRRGAGGPAVPA